MPRCVRKIYARADAGFYCWEAVEAYEKRNVSFIITASKTSRLREELEKARWNPSPKTDADEQCEFQYQPQGWGKAYRYIALRYEKKDEAPQEQYQLMETADYIYRVFVTNLEDEIELLVWFYDQRAGRRESDQRSEQRRGVGRASFAADGRPIACISSWPCWPIT